MDCKSPLVYGRCSGRSERMCVDVRCSRWLQELFPCLLIGVSLSSAVCMLNMFHRTSRKIVVELLKNDASGSCNKTLHFRAVSLTSILHVPLS